MNKPKVTKAQFLKEGRFGGIVFGTYDWKIEDWTPQLSHMGSSYIVLQLAGDLGKEELRVFPPLYQCIWKALFPGEAIIPKDPAWLIGQSMKIRHHPQNGDGYKGRMQPLSINGKAIIGPSQEDQR